MFLKYCFFQRKKEIRACLNFIRLISYHLYSVYVGVKNVPEGQHIGKNEIKIDNRIP